ncbi:hypothetical protein BS50DRAFT_676411 [Corynespora cassiicola Philippines]|uniref:RTA1-domain-containing protein n=1 Tax=Corynespora cassiicola Philippines TaxID=1448308 RepID=A0A2T2NMJ1_CORCC|nr:hypothetical protein BS50DRAFT_676411 [Corynespora cassiicola Philippines]
MSDCLPISPDQHGHVPLGACKAIWPFHPNFQVNLAIAVVFGLLTVAHTAQALLYRKRFCWTMVMAGMWETVAFVLRTLGAKDGRVIPYYVVSTVLFILAPLWINAFLFMLCSRCITASLQDAKVYGIRSSWLTKLFVGADVICFVIQAYGSGLMSSTGGEVSPAKVKTGQIVYLIGCAIQLVFIFLFGLLMSRFYRDIRYVQSPELPFKRIRILCWTIIIRLVFRLAEFGPGVNHDNPLLYKEVYALALDAAPMIVALFLFNIIHPGLMLSNLVAAGKRVAYGRLQDGESNIELTGTSC